MAIGRFKFGGAPELARPLGGLLAPALGAALDASCTPPAAPPLLVPVPLHPRRLRRREFNQALLLVRAARAALGGRRAPLDPFALRRVRDTRPQVDLGAGARVANVAGAFVAAPARVAGRRVVLVDDVLTTGATAAECARALGRAGAARVEVLTLARAVP